MKRIIIALVVSFLILTIVSFITQGTPWLSMMLLLGATIGVPMGLSFPFPLVAKLQMLLGLIISLWAIVYGFRNHHKLIGQALAVAGIFLWSFIGMLGLGTGT